MEVCNVGSQIDFSSFSFFLAEDLFKIEIFIIFFKQKSPVDSRIKFVIQRKKKLFHCLVGRSNI